MNINLNLGEKGCERIRLFLRISIDNLCDVCYNAAEMGKINSGSIYRRATSTSPASEILPSAVPGMGLKF
jgi:hypothetical protein